MQDDFTLTLMKTIAYIKQVAQAHFERARASHDWDHTLRVYRLCERIGAAEAADVRVLRIAALLHDIGRSCQDTSKGAVCHAQRGAELAGPVVEKLPLIRSRKDNIIHCIRSHRFRGDHAPQTLEARVLFDADKLDAIGAVGVARAFLFAGEVGAKLHNPGNNIENTRPYSVDDTGYREYRIKLCKIRDRILTGTGKKMAAGRHAFMEAFFERFIAEHEGRR